MQSISTIEYFIHREFTNNFQSNDIFTIFYILILFASLYILISFFTYEYKKRISLFKFIVYSYISITSILYLKNESWIFSFSKITLESKLTSCIRHHYLYEISLYLFLSYKIDISTKDYYVMLFHHLITLILIILSYSRNMLRYGIFIMALHDCADPFLEMGKIFKYGNQQKIAQFFFAIFVLVFFINRLFLFPYFCIYPAIYYLCEYGHMIFFVFFNIILLSLIFLCNVIWSFFILKTAVKIFSTGVLDDVRENKKN